MSKPQHPYPEHIVEAVAAQFYQEKWGHFGDQKESWRNFSLLNRKSYYKSANRILHALWDASRVPDLDSIDELPEHAIVLDKDGFCAIGREHAITDITNHDLPAHVIYWGDSDE